MPGTVALMGTKMECTFVYQTSCQMNKFNFLLYKN